MAFLDVYPLSFVLVSHHSLKLFFCPGSAVSCVANDKTTFVIIMVAIFELKWDPLVFHPLAISSFMSTLVLPSNIGIGYDSMNRTSGCIPFVHLNDKSNSCAYTLALTRLFN